jgi:hypothetical protein
MTQENEFGWHESWTHTAPPTWALSTITGHKSLSGKIDINPTWRISALTNMFGPCGDGWWYEIVERWVDVHPNASESACFVKIHLHVAGREHPIPTIGGTILAGSNKNGPYVDDESYKKSVTDALGKAALCVGVGANIFTGKGGTGSKYDDAPPRGASPAQQRGESGNKPPYRVDPNDTRPITDAQVKRLYAITGAAGCSEDEVRAELKKGGMTSATELSRNRYDRFITHMCNMKGKDGPDVG